MSCSQSKSHNHAQQEEWKSTEIGEKKRYGLIESKTNYELAVYCDLKDSLFPPVAPLAGCQNFIFDYLCDGRGRRG